MSAIAITPHARRADRSAGRCAPVHRRSAVRLTRRGRAVVLLIGLLIALLVGVVLGATSAATGRPGAPEPTRLVVVQPGDTLWGIASEVAASLPEQGDTRETMHHIAELNRLDSGMVAAGQRLRVPTG